MGLARFRPTWEEHRKWVAGGVALLVLISFVPGPRVGVFVAPAFLALWFAFSFELARPVVNSAVWERRWGWVVHGALLSFLPGVLVVSLLSTGIVPGVDVFGPNYRLDTLILSSIPFLMSAGALIACVHVVRSRGTSLERRFAPYWAVGSVAAFVAGLTLGEFVDTNKVDAVMLAIAIQGSSLLAVFGGLGGILVLWCDAVVRLLRPAEKHAGLATQVHPDSPLTPSFEQAR